MLSIIKEVNVTAGKGKSQRPMDTDRYGNGTNYVILNNGRAVNSIDPVAILIFKKWNDNFNNEIWVPVLVKMYNLIIKGLIKKQTVI